MIKDPLQHELTLFTLGTIDPCIDHDVKVQPRRDQTIASQSIDASLLLPIPLPLLIDYNIHLLQHVIFLCFFIVDFKSELSKECHTSGDIKGMFLTSSNRRKSLQTHERTQQCA